MEAPTVGSIVAIKFPFSDLSSDKVRPALVLGTAEFGDLIVCQITSNPYSSSIAIKVTPDNINGMKMDSYIRPDKIFTSDRSLVVRVVGKVSDAKIRKVKGALEEIFGILK